MPRGHMVRFRFYSPALHKRRSYDVYLPPGYAREAGMGTRFPVLYMLHGSPGHPSLLRNAGNLGVDVDNLLARHAIKPFLVVMPDGRDGTFRSDTEWADTAHGRYESFVLDVVRDADSRLATVPRRRWRAIAGLSEGAYGAMNVALGHLHTFGIVESWSGYFRQARTGVFRHATPLELALNSPSNYVMSLADQIHRLRFDAFIYSGRRDELARQGRDFASELQRAGGHVTFEVVPGRHDWELWRQMMPRSLEYANRWFGVKR